MTTTAEQLRNAIQQRLHAGTEQYARKDAKGQKKMQWVTIGAVDHHGGTPVQIDGDGKILKGPESMTGANIADLKKKAPEKKSGKGSVAELLQKPLASDFSDSDKKAGTEGLTVGGNADRVTTSDGKQPDDLSRQAPGKKGDKMSKYKTELLPDGLKAEMLTGYGKPTIVFRGDTRSYREIIKQHGGKFWGKDRNGRDDPRWTITGDRSIKAAIKSLAKPDSALIDKANEADRKNATAKESRDTFARQYMQNTGAVWASVRGKPSPSPSYGVDIVPDGPDGVLYRQSEKATSGPRPLFRVRLSNGRVEDVEDVTESRLEEFTKKAAAQKAAAQDVFAQKSKAAAIAAETAKARAKDESERFASSHGYTVRGDAITLVGSGAAMQTGRVYNHDRYGWVMVMSSTDAHVSESEIESREDQDNFSGRRSPGRERQTRVIPVEPLDSDVASEAKTAAETTIRRDAAGMRAQAADDNRWYDTAEYKQAIERLQRLEAGEEAGAIIKGDKMSNSIDTMTDQRANEIVAEIKALQQSRKRQVAGEFEGDDSFSEMLPQTDRIAALMAEINGSGTHAYSTGMDKYGIVTLAEWSAIRQSWNGLVRDWVADHPKQNVPSAKRKEWASIVGMTFGDIGHYKSTFAKAGVEV